MCTRKTRDQRHSSPLTEASDDNSICGNTLADLLLDDFIHLISRFEDPRFILWTFEVESDDIKPAEKLSPGDITSITVTDHPGMDSPPFAVQGVDGLS